MAAAGPHRIARMARGAMRRPLISALAVALAIVCASAIGLGVTFAGAETSTVRTGLAVPTEQQQVIDSAAHSCPGLTSARLAGQLMAESGFDPGAATANTGGRGVAGLTDVAWSHWRPNTDATRSDMTANIVALAHDMCDLIGQVRAAKIPGDGWRNALAAFHSGIDAVVKAAGVPSDASGYVDLVAGYAAWYARPAPRSARPAPSHSPAPGSPAGGGGAAKPIPASYLPLVIAAGRTCPTITAARVAAQLMAASAFQPNLVGPAGAQGIAQFLPEIWSQYAPSPTASPWDPSAAIPVLSDAMCDLVSQLSPLGPDPYPLALAAFQWGPLTVRAAGGAKATATLQDSLRTVQNYAQAYATDPQLSDGKLATSSPTPTPAQAQAPTQAQAQPTTARAPANSTGGQGAAPPPPPARAPAKKPAPAAPAWRPLTVTATTVLERGQSVQSNRTELVMENSGDLAIYDENHKRRWSSGTSAAGGTRTVFQADGNLVVYNQNWQQVWSSNTPGRDGAVLVLEADGNVCVVYQGIVVWAANTAH
jgi:hypothetical protein